MAPRIIHRSVYGGMAAPAVLGCLFALTPFSAALAATSGWTDTASVAPSLAGATALGAAPPSQHLHVALTLALRNEAQMDAFITSIGTPGNPAYGSKLTAAQVKSSYMPTDAQVQTVVQYLTSAGFTNIKVASNNLMINADCTVAIAEAAFNTPIQQYEFNGETVYANTQTVELPSSLNGVVTSVHGLQNALRFKPFHNQNTRLPGPVGMAANGRLSQRDAITTATAATAAVQTILPQDFAVTYDVQNVPPASSTYGAIYMSGNLSNIESDLRLAEMEANLPQVPVIITVTDGPLSSTASSGSDEFDLDSQSSQGAATNFKAEIWYDAADGSLAGALNQWVTDDLAPTMSASIGFCEAAAATPAGMEFGLVMADVDPVLKTAVAQGKTFFASTGDNGSYCAAAANGTQAGVPAVNYPASSQYAVAAGGTTVSTYPDFSYGGESGWADSGGGISNFEPSPSWQTGIIPAATVPNPTGGRALPDVSLDADPGSGAYVIIGGAPEAVGGTSLSAPLAMGFWARMEGATGGNLGYAAPLLYGLYAKGASASYATSITGLHDITTGSNGLYSAGAGYDYVTGLGTFDVCVLTGLLGGGDTNYCTTPATPVVNTTYPDTTTVATCALPGINLNITPAAPVLTNPAPVSPPLPIPALTLTSLSVAEPSATPGKIAFTIGVSSLATLPPHFAWQAWFNTPAGQQYYLQMDTYSGVTPEYFYGQAAITSVAGMDLVTYNNIGPLDASSTYSATDNTITLVAPESDFGALAPGQELTYIYSDIMESADYPGTVDTTSVSLYQLRSADLCTAGTTPPSTTPTPVTTPNPVATSSSGSSGDARLAGGGALGGGTLAPLALSALLRRRKNKR